MPQDRYFKNRGKSQMIGKKREDFKNEIRRAQIQNYFAQKRKEMMEQTTRTSSSQQFRQKRIEYVSVQEKQRRSLSQVLVNNQQWSDKNSSVVPTSPPNAQHLINQSKKLIPSKERQRNIKRMDEEHVNRQPSNNANNMKSDQNEYSSQIQNSPTFNLLNSNHSNSGSQNQSSNRNNFHMKKPLPHTSQNKQIQSFNPVQQTSHFHNSPSVINQNYGSPKIQPTSQNILPQYLLNSPIKSSPSSPQSPSQIMCSPQNPQIISQNFRMEPQISYDDSQSNIFESSVSNDLLSSNLSPCPNILGINFVNILSNDKIFQNPDQENEYIKSMDTFKKNLGAKINSPIQEQLPSLLRSPDYSRQLLAKMPSPDQSYPLVSQQYLKNNFDPTVNYHRKKVNNFEEIKQMKRKEQPIKIQQKLVVKPIIKDEENLLKNIQKTKKPTESKPQQNKQRKIISQANFSKYINWGNVIKKHSKYAVMNKVLGKGSYGSVYLGVNIETGQRIAVKKITVKRSKQLLEVDCLKQIQHQNIVTLYDYLHEQKDKECYLFMEFCQENLRQKLDKLKQQKKSKVQQFKIKIDFIQQLIIGMNELNEKGFIHRDLKFQNILVKNNSIIKICDFGLCRRVNNKLEVESVRCGTPYTMAPEIFFHPKNIQQNPTYTEKADIFSLAVIIHEIIYNIHPFDYEEDKLKNLQIFQRKKTKQLAQSLNQKYNLNILWIEEIIQGGLRKLQDRISWDELMKIFKNKNCSKVQIKQNSNKNDEIKGDFMKKKQNPSIEPNMFKKKARIQEVKAKPIEAQVPRFTKQPNYPKFDKQIKRSNPEQKQSYIQEAQRMLGKNIKNQQQQLIQEKENPQSADKNKYVPKINQNRKIEIKVDFKKDLKKQHALFQDLRRLSKKQDAEVIIKSSLQKKEEKIIEIENQALPISSVDKVQSKEKLQSRNFIFILLVLNIIMGIWFILFNSNQNKTSVECRSSQVN